MLRIRSVKGGDTIYLYCDNVPISDLDKERTQKLIEQLQKAIEYLTESDTKWFEV